MTRSILAATYAAMLMMALPAAAQDAGTPMPGTLSAAYPGKAHSPYAKRSFPERPLWGDSHLHTIALDGCGAVRQPLAAP